MKRKSELTNVLDELRNQDPKKRLQAVGMIKEVATVLGPARVKNQLIAFLNEFIDDDQEIVLALLNQLADFPAQMNDPELERCLLPILISFCKTDERVQADKAMEIMMKILDKNQDLILDTIKKLAKTEMNIAKDCAAQLIALKIVKCSQTEGSFFEVYNSILYSENPSIRKIGAKYLKDLLLNCKAKQEIGKMLEIIFNDVDDLPKLLALDALIDYYDINQNLVLNRVKNLFALQSWRINLRICELMSLIGKKFTKSHFKTIIESPLLKLLSSNQPQVRAYSLNSLNVLAQNLSQQQIKAKVLPQIKSLSQDSSIFVKVRLSQNLLTICEYISRDFIQEYILPIAFEFLRAPQFELSIGIMNQFQVLSTYISEETFEDRILKNITIHFGSDDWRLKCLAIDLMGKILHNPSFLNFKTISVILDLATDKIDAVRKKVIDLIVQIMKKKNAEWNDIYIIPNLTKFKDNPSYLHRQTYLLIIQKTITVASPKTLKDVYRPAISLLLNDRIPNIRAIALSILKENPKIIEGTIIDSINRLKDDKDAQIRAILKTMDK